MFDLSRWRFAALLCSLLLLLACKDDPERAANEGDSTARAGAGSGAEAGAGQAGSTGSTAGQDAGAQDPKPFAPGSFSAEHKAEITKDCNETLQCYAQMGMELPDDPMSQCLDDSALTLDQASAALQTKFLNTVERCGRLVVCDYYNCAISGK